MVKVKAAIVDFMFFKSVKRNVDVEKKKRLNWEKLVAGFGF
tara:strand:- start:278 stop:400 length:123 start_codon:yes stop_codon:yes gene_type:complete